MRWLSVIAALAGCATVDSSYRPTRVDSSELMWAYHNGFQVTRDGKVLSEQGDWRGLGAAVACVPRALALAQSAESRARSGKVLTWSGVALMIAGTVFGAALIAHDTSNDRDVGIGVLTATGGLVGGGTMLVIGIVRRLRADVTAIDAVNLFNDERRTCAGGIERVGGMTLVRRVPPE